MTTVTVALREYPELLIYRYHGVAMAWQEEVIHSQGTLKAKRRDLIQEELKRIENYQSKGDLVSPEQVLSYFNKRETVFQQCHRSALLVLMIYVTRVDQPWVVFLASKHNI